MKLTNSRILPLVLIVSALLALSGCNNSSSIASSGTTTTTTYFENTTAVPLPDQSTNDSEINATNAVDNITKVTVTIDITHTYTGDLAIDLISPQGTTVMLTSGADKPGDDYNNTTFDDDASTSILDGTAPFTGTYSPEGALSDFAGEDANGVWTLHIEDLAGGDEGTLNSWSLTIE